VLPIVRNYQNKIKMLLDFRVEDASRVTAGDSVDNDGAVE